MVGIEYNMEDWKDIIGYEGHYQISNLGRVKSFKNGERIIGTNNKPNSAGYIDIQLCLYAKVKHFTIHRLVADHFCAKKDVVNPVVNHIDGDKLNNNYLNLEWVSNSENHLHAISLGLRKKGGDLSFSKKVHQYNRNGEYIKSYNSVIEASVELGINRHNIAQCARGKCKTYKGYIFKYDKK
jgi:hypothetical protein